MTPGRSCRFAALAIGVGWLAGAPFARSQQAGSPPPPAPPPSASPVPAAPPAPPPAQPATTPLPSPSPSPTPPAGDGQATLIDTLSPGELQEAVNLLRANYVRPPDADDRAIARATLSGLLTRLDHGAMLLPRPPANGAPPATPAADALPDAFFAEVIGERTGYVRLGAMTRDHLGDLDRTLKDFSDKKLPALVLDLRATGGSSDYELAADVLRRFVAKGKPLFTLRKPSNNQERLFTSNANPAYGGVVLLAVDADTAGAAETVAAVVRFYNRALVVGTPTAGQAVEYADLRLSGGTLLRVAVSQVVLPANLSIFPQGVKPDLPARTGRADKLAVFSGSQAGKSIVPYVFEAVRPRFNEAALVSGVNPEYDAARDRQAAQRRGEPPPKPPVRDAVLQRAFDLATTLPALDNVRAPEAR